MYGHPRRQWHGGSGYNAHAPLPTIAMIDAAVAKVYSDLLAYDDSVTAWKVSQLALATLKADSFESLGFHMQNVPSLYRIMVTEAKINSFIHCFVGVQKITSLYDLEMAICESEGIKGFEELKLGPLLKHPLVVHYFSVGSDVTEILKITSEQIITYLNALLRKKKKITVDDLLDYIAKRKNTARGNLCARIQSLGMHIGHIMRGRRSEFTLLKKCSEGLDGKLEHDDNEDDDGDNAKDEGNDKNESQDFGIVSSHDASNSDPSAAAQAPRIWLDTEMDLSSAIHDSKSGDDPPSEGKRGPGNRSYTRPVIHKTPTVMPDGSKLKPGLLETGFVGYNEVDPHTWMFIKIWRETCERTNVVEVFDQMLDFYNSKRKKKKKSKALNAMLSSYPHAGLLNVAIASIKLGLWDCMSCASQPNCKEVPANTISNAVDVNMEVEPAEKDVLVAGRHVLEGRVDVALDDVLKNVLAYFELSDYIPDNINSHPKKPLIFVREICKLKRSLTRQFSIDDFETLGFGDFLTFLEEHVSLLPRAWHDFFFNFDRSEKPSVKVCMSQCYLLEFLSQAVNGLGEHETLSKSKVSELLGMQYPSAGLTLLEDDATTDLLTTVSKNRSDVSSNILVFSSTLSAFGTYKGFSDPHVGTKDAIELLLRAPMLVDLAAWSYWDHKFAPSLGPLVGWLLNEVTTKELLCLVTKDGKVLRIDHTATVDSFLEAFLQGSSYQTAVELLSLIALYGGERNVPLPLLKCHAETAFEVMVKIYSDKEGKDDQRSVHFASRFLLDCLGYLPTEFQRFAADLLVSAFRKIVKDAPSVILSQCKCKDDYLMLHELGLFLGVVEWFDGYHTSCLSESKESLEHNRREKRSSAEDEVILSHEVNQPSDDCEGDGVMVQRGQSADDGWVQPMSESERESSSAKIIESIRREEFGLDPNLSVTESSILKKQHARLGRALHCLSQELYSQDSHFLLELVQNADDNAYSRNMEPTLAFILQEKGIVVLNNEHGFSAENIRALCDVGNSTKKAASAGYIGKKGIGFKSVFRITDAPEIHSNGFHIKFDLSEGQIGFVLPTIVPPCDINLFRHLVSLDTTDQGNGRHWNTCIVLPFKSKLTETSAVENVISMFSDLHPSLLLFLHRLQCIKFRNMLKDSFVVMRKEIVGNGLMNVSFGKELLTWFVESRKLQANVIRGDVKTTEISIAFALEVSGHGDYIPKLDQQYVFAFLPLRTYGLKFIIQGDFILPSSREEVDGDSPWNQWLLSEFPSLFVSSERSFCSLPGFRGCLGKGISAFLSYVPLVGEVHGFFATLPRMIISKLCTSNCLLLEGDNDKWVPPCRVLRNWNEQARALLPESLIQEHLGLGYLNSDIVLSDTLARALGIENYGPKILVQMVASLCCTREGLRSMGLGWLSSWLNVLYELSLHSGQSSVDFEAGSDIMNILRRTPFIPLLDGCYGSIDEGMIWMNSDALRAIADDEHGLEAFGNLFSNLRIVNPALFDGAIAENLTHMLYKVGVQRLSVHEVVKVHVLPFISDKKNTIVSKDLMTEYLSFIMAHVQSRCADCSVERAQIISEVYNSAFILTNHGFIRPVEAAIHFSNDFGNHIDVGRLINGTKMKWHEVDKAYLKYPVAKSMSGGRLNWRSFLQELRVTDFVQTVRIEKTVVTDMMREKVIIPPGSTVDDWESHELVHLLSAVSSSGDLEKCRHLMVVLDTIWDDYFSDKSVAYCNMDGESKPVKSGLVSALNDVPWVASSVDDRLYHPNELFHDCEAVRSILGDTAHYAVPKVLSEKLVTSIGFKTSVTLGDTLSVIAAWKSSAASFKASVSQMHRFYAFIWNELASSNQKNMENLRSGAFIFVPGSSASPGEVVPGVLLSPQEVYWHDGMIPSQCEFNKMLSNFYPSLHDFFVDECGVKENPPLLDYLEILRRLSTVDSPLKAAKKVFDVFLMWGDGLKSGQLSLEDVEMLKKNLEAKDTRVLPTAHDTWVSLHPSFGLVCWCDDEKLTDEFEKLNNIDFLHLCELTDEEKTMLQVKVSLLMQALGIPALSEVVTREAIYYGPGDNSYETSLVSWVLPYAQRYISNTYRERYLQLKLSGFEKLNRLQIVVVEKLFYKNVIKRSKMVSKKRHDCSCLLQDDILYATRGSDSHSIFMELSCFLVNGKPELHLANFLYMITDMNKSGSTKDEIETFILNSQKVPKLAEGEPVWSVQRMRPTVMNMEIPATRRVPKRTIEPNASDFKRRSGSNSNWPPDSWQTAPRFNDLKMQDVAKPIDVNAYSAEEHPLSIEQVVNLEHSTSPNNEGHGGTNEAACVNVEPEVVDHDGSPGFSERDQLSHGAANMQQALVTGRRGEEVAFNYYARTAADKPVRWVNEANETGLPYDLVVGDEESQKEYIEVKTTDSAGKDWFEISVGEWQFAVEKGESYSVARVVLSADKPPRVTIFKNPARLCRLGHLKLAVVMSRRQKD